MRKTYGSVAAGVFLHCAMAHAVLGLSVEDTRAPITSAA